MNSIIGMCVAAILVGLTMLGSSVAFTAISSIGIIGLEVSYIIPIALRLTTARNWFKKVGALGWGGDCQWRRRQQQGRGCGRGSSLCLR